MSRRPSSHLSHIPVFCRPLPWPTKVSYSSLSLNKEGRAETGDLHMTLLQFVKLNRMIAPSSSSPLTFPFSPDPFSISICLLPHLFIALSTEESLRLHATLLLLGFLSQFAFLFPTLILPREAQACWSIVWRLHSWSVTAACPYLQNDVANFDNMLSNYWFGRVYGRRGRVSIFLGACMHLYDCPLSSLRRLLMFVESSRPTCV